MRIGILTAQDTWELTRTGPAARHLAHSLERHARTAEAVAAALAARGHETVAVPVDGSLQSRLHEAAVDLVFNTYFGPGRRQDQACIASLLEYAGLPFTGGGAACHYLGLSKPLSKLLFMAHAIPTPPFVDTTGLEHPAIGEAAAAIGFPLIVKTAAEGEGIGLDEGSVVSTPDELERAVARVTAAFTEAPLIERFLPGREFTVGVLDGTPPVVLPILELVLGPTGIYSYDAKVSGGVDERCPAPLEEPVARNMGDLAVRAGRALGCQDCWRVDFRMDAGGSVFVLEVNTLPGLMPGYSDLPKIAEAAGLDYERLVAAILASAARRDQGS
ncbi:MAG: hypothetical protein NTU62_15535 [Spirochaetes bacterium]|nr:hypothetical protein [Spirochaetota bacterium]